MNSLESELRELEQSRRAMIEQIYSLLDELEDRPGSRRSRRRHPVNLLESAVNRLVLALERAAAKAVAVALNWLNSRRS